MELILGWGVGPENLQWANFSSDAGTAGPHFGRMLEAVVLTQAVLTWSLCPISCPGLREAEDQAHVPCHTGAVAITRVGLWHITSDAATPGTLTNTQRRRKKAGEEGQLVLPSARGRLLPARHSLSRCPVCPSFLLTISGLWLPYFNLFDVPPSSPLLSKSILDLEAAKLESSGQCLLTFTGAKTQSTT